MTADNSDTVINPRLKSGPRLTPLRFSGRRVASALPEIVFNIGMQGHCNQTPESMHVLFSRIPGFTWEQRQSLFEGENSVRILCLSGEEFAKFTARHSKEKKQAPQPHEAHGLLVDRRLILADRPTIQEMVPGLTYLLLRHLLSQGGFEITGYECVRKIAAHRLAQMEKAGLDDSTLVRYRALTEKSKTQSVRLDSGDAGFLERVRQKLQNHFVSLEATHHTHPEAPSLDTFLEREEKRRKTKGLSAMWQMIVHGTVLQKLFTVPFFLVCGSIYGVGWILRGGSKRLERQFESAVYFKQYQQEAVEAFLLESWSSYLIDPSVLRRVDPVLYGVVKNLDDALKKRKKITFTDLTVALRELKTPVGA